MPPSAPSPNIPAINFDATSENTYDAGERARKNTPSYSTDNINGMQHPGSLYSHDSLIPHGPQNYSSGIGQNIYSVPFSAGGYGGMYGGGMYGYGAGGLYGAGVGPVSNLNQLLFGIQNVIFSLTQAVQIIGMNTEAVKKLLEAATAMFDHAVSTWKEMKALEAGAMELETENDRKRRRRLRVLRWALTTAVAYAAYTMVRHVVVLSSQRRSLQRLKQRHA